MDSREFLDGRVTLHGGDCLKVLAGMPDACVDSVVTDPPYALVSIVKRFGKANAAPAKGNEAYARASAGFMGKQWDTGETAFAVEFWAQVLRVLKPGGHVVAFSGTRTYHRLAIAIEDAGFEIRDQLAWVYGSGFPKSHDVAKAIDRAAGVKGEYGEAKTEAHRRYIETGEMRGGRGHDGWQRPWMDDREAVEKAGRQYLPGSEEARAWQGWGTALKPAWEPIVLGRKPLIGTVANNVIRFGTGALNVDACRVGEREKPKVTDAKHGGHDHNTYGKPSGGGKLLPPGRWPANLAHDGSAEVLAMFPDSQGSASGGQSTPKQIGTSIPLGGVRSTVSHNDSGSAARFFYTAKADAVDRIASKHPTVKPVDLMQWLCRMVTPPGGVVLDPFAGTGTTAEAAWREGMRCILVERETDYQADIARRMELAAFPSKRAAVAKVKGKLRGAEGTPLFPEVGS
ncbi:site-specific DNA-methyltransferase [Rhizobium leguminosarum]|uniref:site-specific DNA-methyltransferase (adenine-specific) n=1 Tax=Rhizobium ruizarguesonis TaxID=2081791 RepID=A0AAE5C691_9HYPH|nr:DNA methyltransferase [Rhizobium ruizarguesonis]NEI52680.1 site-specific DNA-methyltransferase [Rhizobium ruizarguesonis]